VDDGMKWNQPLLRGMPRLVDDSGRSADKGDEVKRVCLGTKYGGKPRAAGMGTAAKLFDIDH